MAKLTLESKMDFDHSVGTEDRFNLRNWLLGLIEILNQSNPNIWEEVLAEDFTAQGLVDNNLDRAEFLQFMREQYESGEFALRYPSLTVSVKDDKFVARGMYESFSNGVLSFQGEVDIVIGKDGNNFYLEHEKFYPRFRVQR